MPVPLDEYMVHQVPASLGEVGTTDRNFYDRCYFNAHDRSGAVMLVAGLGIYPNLGVIDAYATIRIGTQQWSVRSSDALDRSSLEMRVGPFLVAVVEPLWRLDVVCEAEPDNLGFELSWEGSFPCFEEPRHRLRQGSRTIIDGCRFCQLGTWAGTILVDGRRIDVRPDRWVGCRDRSWGIRPVGEPEPPGRWSEEAPSGFWWLYSLLRFDDFALIVILQEEPDGTRTLNEAARIWGDGRHEQLGWPEVEIVYQPGTRHPERALIQFRRSLQVEIEMLTSVALNVGAGYGGDPEWSHGQWRGRAWTERAVYDLTDPRLVARAPFGVIDHAARARIDAAEGWGLFEHASIGRHDPSGFATWSDVAR
jgi:hypothetical protein